MKKMMIFMYGCHCNFSFFYLLKCDLSLTKDRLSSIKILAPVVEVLLPIR